jgi:hypothetical protein
MYVHRRTLVAVADRFLGVGCSLITSLMATHGPWKIAVFMENILMFNKPEAVHYISDP